MAANPPSRNPPPASGVGSSLSPPPSAVGVGFGLRSAPVGSIPAPTATVNFQSGPQSQPPSYSPPVAPLSSSSSPSPSLYGTGMQAPAMAAPVVSLGVSGPPRPGLGLNASGNAGPTSIIGAQNRGVGSVINPPAGILNAPPVQSSVQIFDRMGKKEKPAESRIPRITQIQIEGGPYHTNVLLASYTFAGGAEGRSRIQWFRSMGDKWFAPIPGATTLQYQPTAEDLHCQIRVEITPIRVDGVEGPSVIGHVNPTFLTMDPAVAKAVERNVKEGEATWNVVFNGEPRQLVANKQKVKLRYLNKTKMKEEYGPSFQIALHPTNDRVFMLTFQKQRVDLLADSNSSRDIIALTINSFFSMLLGARMRSKSKSGDDRVISLKEIRSAENRASDPVTSDAPRAEITVTGGPYHTSLLVLQKKYTGGKEGASLIQWYRSQHNWYYTAIRGATGDTYQPSVEDLNCKLRVEYTPVREDGIRGPTNVANIPDEFLSVDPRLSQMVEKNILCGEATFDVNVFGKVHEKRQIFVDNNSVKIMKSLVAVVKSRHDRVKTQVDVTDKGKFTIIFNKKISYIFTVVDDFTRDLILLTISTFSSLSSLAKKNPGQATALGYRDNKPGSFFPGKDTSAALYVQEDDVDIWGGWGEWSKYSTVSRTKGKKVTKESDAQSEKDETASQRRGSESMTASIRGQEAPVAATTTVIQNVAGLTPAQEKALKDLKLPPGMMAIMLPTGELAIYPSDMKAGDQPVMRDGKLMVYSEAAGIAKGSRVVAVSEPAEAPASTPTKPRSQTTSQPTTAPNKLPPKPDASAKDSKSAADELAELKRVKDPTALAKQQKIASQISSKRPQEVIEMNPMFNMKGGSGRRTNKYSALANGISKAPPMVPGFGGPGGPPPPPPPPPGMGGAPPPPPPPPGMGGPPPPPPPPGALGADSSQPKTKQLHWQKVGRGDLADSVWEHATDLNVDVDDEILQAMFKAEASKDISASGGKPRATQLLDSKRLYIIEILLESSKMPIEDIVRAITDMKVEVLPEDSWRQLAQYSPSEEEEKMIRAYDGDRSHFGRPENFFLKLIEIPHLKSRLDAITFKLDLAESVPEIEEQLQHVSNASNQIVKNKKFTRLLEIVLAFGNYLNFGTAKGYALGFRIDTLLKLADTRAVDRKTTLLHFLANYINEREPEVMSFLDEMPDVANAVTVSIPMMNAELEGIVQELQRLEQVVEEATESGNTLPKGDRFVELMANFMEEATDKIDKLIDRGKVMKTSIEKLAKHFAEDPASFDPDSLFVTLFQFSTQFNNAHKDNTREKEKIAKAIEKGQTVVTPGAQEAAKKPPIKRVNPMDMMLEVNKGFSGNQEDEDTEDTESSMVVYDDAATIE